MQIKKPLQIITTEEHLLDNIYNTLDLMLQELKQMNHNEKVETKIENKKVEQLCKYCNGTHENKGQVLACAKKFKKEGVNNGNK